MESLDPCERQRDTQKRERQRPGPCRPFALAKHREQCGRGPVLQRRLLEVFEPVETRGDPVAARCHFTRNLCVAAFIGLRQWVQPRRGEPKRSKPHPYDPKRHLPTVKLKY